MEGSTIYDKTQSATEVYMASYLNDRKADFCQLTIGTYTRTFLSVFSAVYKL
jgi:hypothetical protein